MTRRSSRIQNLALGALAAASCFASPSLAAETRVVTWGDSITFGHFDGTSAANDCAAGSPPTDAPEQCGFPGRLGSRLDDAAKFSPIYDIEILNLGRGGEKTPQALNRMDRESWTCPCENLDPGCGNNSLKYWYCNGYLQPGDLLVLMEGTNDITQQDLSTETIRFNLEALGAKAEALGLNVVLSTVTPRHPDAWTAKDGCASDGNADAIALNSEIVSAAITNGWPTPDPYSLLKSLSALYNNYYQSWDPMKCEDPLPDCDVESCDPVGHVNRYGYDAIACNGTKSSACTTSGANYSKTFESAVRSALPPRLTLSAPTPPLTSGVSLPFSVTLPDLATFTQTIDLTWDFGDGTVVPQVVSTSPVAQNHTYWYAGEFTVTVTAQHANGGQRQAASILHLTAGSTIFLDGFESGGTTNWIVNSN